MASVDEISKWQRRLEETFTYQGVVAGRLLPAVVDQEHRCSAVFVKTYRGYQVLSDCFLDFFAETLHETLTITQRRGWPQDRPWYAPCFLAFLTQFRGVRAAEMLATNGYPLSGYALQRNLKDQAIFLNAVVSGVSSFEALNGTKGMNTSQKPEEADHLQVLRNRRREEASVFDQTIGKRSGLSSEHVRALQRWNQLFNMEVHGARLTNYREANTWILQKGNPSIGPRVDREADALYMNRANEITWMTLRALPFLQLEGAPFPRTWADKWGILDESCSFMVKGLEKIGKAIATAFMAMINSKFTASPASRYVEHA